MTPASDSAGDGSGSPTSAESGCRSGSASWSEFASESWSELASAFRTRASLDDDPAGVAPASCRRAATAAGVLATSDELYLDLTPHQRFGAAGGLADDVIVGDLRERRTLLAEEWDRRPRCVDRGDRAELVIANVDPDRIGERTRRRTRRAAERAVDLDPRVVDPRMLDMPPGVGSTGASPQRHTGLGEPEVVGVEVGRRQVVLRRRSDRADTRDVAQIRELELSGRVEA